MTESLDARSGAGLRRSAGMLGFWRRGARDEFPKTTTSASFRAGLDLESKPAPSAWSRYAIAAILVLIAGLASEGWYHLLSHHRNLGMPFIIALTLAGAWGGVRPALFAAALSFAIYRYCMTEPFYTLTLDGSDILPVSTFLLTAVLVGGLAGQLSDRARSAADRLRRLTVLFSASKDFSAAANRTEVAQRLTEWLKSDVGFESAVYATGRNGKSLLARTNSMPGVLEGADGRCGGTIHSIPLRTARGEVGGVSIWSNDPPIDESNRYWIEALLQLGAIALDRAELATEISEARLVAEREGLRTALLSSLSHDLRTPIATIMASATSLSDLGEQFDLDTRRDLLETIQDQAERLNRYVGNLLDMTRLETGVLVVKKSLVDPAEALASALEHSRRRLQGLTLVRSFEPLQAAIMVDPILLEQALVNILDNAAKYAPPGSRIHVGVQPGEGEVELWIEDEGPGIARDEIPRIFDKFFRGSPDGGRHAGVGLGLTVVRGVVEAFGGRVKVESPIANGRGARFSIMLPAHDVLETVW